MSGPLSRYSRLVGERERRQAQAAVLQMSRLSLQLIDAAAESVRDGDLMSDLPVMLMFLLDAEGPLRPSTIQDATSLSSGGVTKLVERLEQRGLVQRKTGAVDGDRRGVLVELTRRGRNAVRSMADAMADALREAQPDVDELVATLQR
jgi:DNA-binding MarR family transcriptional regulator